MSSEDGLEGFESMPFAGVPLGTGHRVAAHDGLVECVRFLGASNLDRLPDGVLYLLSSRDDSIGLHVY